MRPHVGFLLIPVALFLIAVAFMASAFSRAEPLSPLRLYAPCRALTSDGLWACDKDRHAWKCIRKKCVDAGLLSPAVPVPKN